MDYKQRMAKRKRQLNKNNPSQAGFRKVGDNAHGGGGPENMGARTDNQAGVSLREDRPAWAWEDFHGYRWPASESTTPNNAGIPANNFRQLGELYGGRG